MANGPTCWAELFKRAGKAASTLGEFSCRLAADMTMHRYLHNLKSRSTALTCGLSGLPEPVADPEIARIAADFRTDALSPKGSRLTLD